MILTALPFTQFISVVQLFLKHQQTGRISNRFKDDMKYEEKITKDTEEIKNMTHVKMPLTYRSCF